MQLTETQRARAANPAFPAASTFPAEFQLQTMMEPNVLWLAEWACGALELKPGLKVLDLGCGKAASSIFMARTYGATVWAADLWIRPTENLARVEAFGLGDRVFPLKAEAHGLPFAEGYFDVIVSFDAFHYFGTDDLYIGYVSKFLRPGGALAIVSPGVTGELGDEPPAHLRPYWHWDFCSFHTPAWWRRHWTKTGLLDVTLADWLPNGWRHWAEWGDLCVEVGAGLGPVGGERGRREVEMLRLDAGRTLGFVRVVARIR